MKQEEGEANNKIEGLPKYASDKMFMYKHRIIFKFVIQYFNILYSLFLCYLVVTGQGSTFSVLGVSHSPPEPQPT